MELTFSTLQRIRMRYMDRAFGQFTFNQTGDTDGNNKKKKGGKGDGHGAHDIRIFFGIARSFIMLASNLLAWASYQQQQEMLLPEEARKLEA